MNITILDPKGVTFNGENVPQGTVLEVHEGRAEAWLHFGQARKAEPGEEPKKAAPSRKFRQATHEAAEAELEDVLKENASLLARQETAVQILEENKKLWAANKGFEDALRERDSIITGLKAQLAKAAPGAADSAPAKKKK